MENQTIKIIKGEMKKAEETLAYYKKNPSNIINTKSDIFLTKEERKKLLLYWEGYINGLNEILGQIESVQITDSD